MPNAARKDGAKGTAGFVPTARLDALTDAVFAFAMTLLVINIELPDDFDPKTTHAFLQGLAGLSDTFIAYLITFVVLVAFWSGRAQATYDPEMASPAYARATLFHLLWVTVLPFSMLAVSRYNVAGAVWLYGANMILLAVTGILIARAAKRDSGHADAHDGRIEFALLIASAILSMLISLVSTDYAMLAYLLNVAAPYLRRRVGG
ncbi:TMEM175 family protein [Methyloceanibacter sp. wino2]|uniref:TMEM175 family protein n=1 Tax=Methyloceanibacter sp. wino2 TaxID=2170729 RepID=UPI000D3E2934|nr:TMEM175 family protein [Methyloceanibacter sp. wino2]